MLTECESGGGINLPMPTGCNSAAAAFKLNIWLLVPSGETTLIQACLCKCWESAKQDPLQACNGCNVSLKGSAANCTGPLQLVQNVLLVHQVTELGQLVDVQTKPEFSSIHLPGLLP